MTKVKICGITNLADAKAAVSAGAFAIGFVLAKSPRRISPDKAMRIIKSLGKRNVRTVGVFVNERQSKVKDIQGKCFFDIIQFHGDETPAYCSRFRKLALVYKAFRLKSKSDVKKIIRYNVDGYVLDAFSKSRYGGTGKTFDWGLAELAKSYKRPIILSGGLNSENVALAIKRLKPYIVDVSSGVESRPGKKNAALIKKFIKKTKESK